jgi:hypothetical protein
MIVLERSDGRAEVFFFDIRVPRLVTPLAIAVAHLERVSQMVSTITASLRDSSPYKVLDQIRYEDVVLHFEPDN